MTAVAFSTVPPAGYRPQIVDVPLPGDVAADESVPARGALSWGPSECNIAMAAWDGLLRGACGQCLHPSIRLYGPYRLVANHPEMRQWRKVHKHRYVLALVATTARCWGSGQPARYAGRAAP